MRILRRWGVFLVILNEKLMLTSTSTSMRDVDRLKKLQLQSQLQLQCGMLTEMLLT